MDWITPNIGIGSVHDVRDAEALRRNGVRPVLALIDDGASTTAADLGLVRDRGRSAR